MFAGLDGIDWAAMHHAYGPADEVPGMLRGLVSQDEAVRLAAEEGMWGAVHHQGDVYDSTVATIPFLLDIACTSGTGQRAALDLLGSFGGVDVSRLLEDGDPLTPVPEGPTYVAARKAVAAARGRLIDQLDSSDAEVRGAAVAAVLVGRPNKALALRLREMHARESVPDARSIAQAALGWLSRKGVAGLDAWVREQVTSENPKTRLLALTEVARRGEPPATGVLVETVHAVYDTHGPPVPAPARGGLLRRRPAARVRRAEAERWEIDRLAEALPEPSPLLLALLASHDWEVAVDAISPASDVIGRVRGRHAELAELIGAQLEVAPDAAARALEWIGPLAEPAREALARATRNSSTVAALATLRDPRVIPDLRRMLRQPVPPQQVGLLVARTGAAAAPLHAEVRRALRSPGHALPGLLNAVGALGIQDAVEDVRRWLPEGAAIRALRLLGPSAAKAAASLRNLLDDKPRTAVPAAHALWAVDEDRAGAEVVLAALGGGADQFTFRSAADAAGEMGLVAAEPLLRRSLGTDDPYGWLHFAAARALWRLTADAASVLPVIRACWAKNDAMLLDLAQFLVEMGEASGPLHDLVQRELSETTRFTTRRGAASSDQVTRDLQLLQACRAVVGRP